jgi:probable rRNA maturation factor
MRHAFAQALHRPAHAAAVTMRRPRLALCVQYAVPAEALPARPLLRKWTLAALENDATVTLRFVNAAEGRKLNRSFRGKDHPTNVLSFVYDDAGDAICGDVVLCVAVIEREAAAQGKPLAAHCAHLVVHGMLHLQGYEHEHEADASRMEQREREVLARLGFADPYSAPVLTAPAAARHRLR